MIEIEKKFLLTEVQKQRLLEGATPLGDKRVADSYLDTEDNRLTLADYWFRLRDGVYELKAPLKSGSGDYAATNRYRELTTEAEIATELQLDVTGGVDFETILARAGIAKFMTVYTNRSSYEKDGFHIDIDAADYEGSDFTYAVGEVERLIEDESQADVAEAEIFEFAQRFDLETDAVVLGKVAAYLKEQNPNHYAALQEAGVLK